MRDAPLQLLPRALPQPCFKMSPQAEVEHWCTLLVNCPEHRRDELWTRIPLYTQYVQEHTLTEIVEIATNNMEYYGNLCMRPETAGQLPRNFGAVTLLPLAVVTEYLRIGTGKPAAFTYDAFMAALASLLRKDVALALYASTDPSFLCKPRWWATPTGDPNAGRSPSFSFIKQEFKEACAAAAACVLPGHTCGAGNLGKFQERLRSTEGVGLLWGPESKPVLDPNFPFKGTTDTGKFIDFSRFLECANGGAFEWGTGSEEKARRQARERPDHNELTLPELRFDETNINICLFQQFSVFRSWWARVEHTQACGFTARLVTGFTGRAVVDRQLGRQPQASVSAVLRKIWTDTATTWGHISSPASNTFRPSPAAQDAICDLYYNIHDLENTQSWRSAIKAAFGKMEYLVPSAALLTHLSATSWTGEHNLEVSNEAMKCGILHYSTRLFLGCAVTDTEAAEFATRSGAPQTLQADDPLSSEEALAKKVLLACVRDPICMTDLSQHVSVLRGAAKHADRMALFRFLESKGLGSIRETRRRGDGEGRNQAFHRGALNSSAQAFLQSLRIPLGMWPTNLSESHTPEGLEANLAGNAVVVVPSPRMSGAGKRARRQAPAAQAEEPKKKGRPAAGAVDIYSVKTGPFAIQPPFDGKAAFLEHELQWATRTVAGHTLNIRHQWYPCSSGFKLLLWCNSCTCCKTKNGWRGYSCYSSQASTICREFTPSDKHGDFSAMKAWTPLTSTAENALKEFVKANPRFTTQDLVKIVEGLQGNRPADAWLQRWARNHRVHKGNARDRLTAFKWVEADWQRIQRQLGSVESTDAVPDALKVAGAQFRPEATVVVFCSPALLHTTLHRLVNKEYIKLCGDGTFRLVKDDEWVLLTVGALSKHYAPASGIYAFRSTFNPLAFAVANKENEDTYRFFFESLVGCARQFAGVDLPTVCHQYHADLHAGEHLAMKSVFPNADRVADWAHVTGACVRPQKHLAAVDPRGRLAAYRAGIFKTMKSALTTPGQSLLPLIERAFYCLRTVPTALLFHAIARSLVDTLLAQQPPERKAARLLMQHYFERCDPALAQTRFDIISWQDYPAPLVTADWWCGVQRVQPGSASGTQAQESWHRHKLKAYLGLRTSISTFVDNLAKFAQSRLLNLKAEDSPLPDVPLEPFPDKMVLMDSDWLTSQGRTSAQQLHRTKCYDVWADASATVFAMPSTLAKWDHAQKAWTAVSDSSVTPFRTGVAAKLGQLLRAKDHGDLIAALRGLGLGPEPFTDIEALPQFFNKHALVLVGEEAARYWRRTTPQGELLHVQGVCAFCSHFAVHGTCEHLHAAFLHLGHISVSAPIFPSRQQAVPASERESVSVLLPAAQRVAREPSSSSRRTAADTALPRLLSSLGLSTWLPALQQEELSIAQIASLQLAELRIAAPSMPSGALLRLQAAAQAHTARPLVFSRAHDLTCASPCALCRRSLGCLPQSAYCLSKPWPLCVPDHVTLQIFPWSPLRRCNLARLQRRRHRWPGP